MLGERRRAIASCPSLLARGGSNIHPVHLKRLACSARSERVDDFDPAPDKTIVKILAQQLIAPRFGCCCENDRIKDAQLVLVREGQRQIENGVCCRQHRELLTPKGNTRGSLVPRHVLLSHQDVMKFDQGLRGDKQVAGTGNQGTDDLQHFMFFGFIARNPPAAIGINKQIGVEGNPQLLSIPLVQFGAGPRADHFERARL
jgi:hypothetical protein